MINKIWRNILRWKAKKDLLFRYEYLVEVNKLLEEYDMDRITNFDELGRREDLVKIQQEMKAQQELINFLKTK